MKDKKSIFSSESTTVTTGSGGTRLSRRVMKVMGMFAGLQSFNIICSIVKMKLVSIWLQSAGVALFGILATAQETIATFTDLGLRQSTVRDVAAEAENNSRLSRIAMLVRRWSVLAGLLGATVILALSPVLGEWFFDDFAGCIPFALMSVSMFFNCLLYGEQSLLQGTGMLRSLAKGSLQGTMVGLIVSIPMFRWLGMESVPLSFIVYSIAIWGFTFRARYRSKEKVMAPGLRQLWNEGKGFVRLGILMSMATFLTSMSRLIFVGVLTRVASLDTTGLYQAGDTLVSRYIGLIFTAIGMEFFPRLVSCVKSRRRTSVYVNHEIILLLTVVTPVALVFILCREIVVDVLFSKEFLPILTFISLAVTGTILKSMSWCMAICIIARGNGRLYLLVEGIDALLSLGLLIGGYLLWGLDGLGWAYIAWNLLYVVIVWIACKSRYGIVPSSKVVLALGVSVMLCGLACCAMQWFPVWLAACCILPFAISYFVPLRRLMAKR